MKTIPLSLISKNCADYAAIAAEWPDGIPVTRASAKRAAELRININWVAERSLARSKWYEFNRLDNEASEIYYRACDKADEECELVKEKEFARYRCNTTMTLLKMLSKPNCERIKK